MASPGEGPYLRRHDDRTIPKRHTALQARWLTAALALLLLSGPLTAGFDTAGGKEFSVGDGSDSDANKAEVQPLVDQLMKPVDEKDPTGVNSGLGLTKAQAEERVKQIRENLKQALELAKLRMSADRAKFLDDQFKNGKIKVGWGMKANGTCDVDSTAGKVASEKITVAIEGLLNGPKQITDAAIIQLSCTLVHENEHAGQSYKLDPPPNPTDDQKKATKGKQYCSNEYDAHFLNALWWLRLQLALENPDATNPNKPIPEGTDPAVAAILQAIRQIGDPVERAKLIQKLLDLARMMGLIEENAKDCFHQLFGLFAGFLTNFISLDDIKHFLNELKWEMFVRDLGDFTVVYEELPRTIHQLGATGPGPDIDTGLKLIEDFFVWPLSSSISVLLVTGEDASGFGELQAYVDTDGDHSYEPATKFVLFTHESQLQTNMTLFRNELTGKLYVYDGNSRLVHELVDSNLDGVPDQLGSPINPPDPLLGWYSEFQFDPESPVPTIVAYHLVVAMQPAMPCDDTALRLRDLDGDGNFETIDEPSFDQLAVWDPTFDPDSFVHLQSSVNVYAMPSSSLQVWLTDDSGALLQFRGSGLGQGLATPSTVSLFPPFQYGEQMVILDTTHDLRSPNALLSPWQNLSNPLIGSLGFPELTGTGNLSAGSLVTLSLADAAPLQPSALILGVSTLYAPFKGGTMVPNPYLILPGLLTDSTGQLVLQALWPPGLPPGFEFCFQHWIHDSGGMKGFAASNAIVGTTS